MAPATVGPRPGLRALQALSNAGDFVYFDAVNAKLSSFRISLGDIPFWKEPFNLRHGASFVHEGMETVPCSQDAGLHPAEDHGGDSPNLRWSSARFAQEDFRRAHGKWLDVDTLAGRKDYQHATCVNKVVLFYCEICISDCCLPSPKSPTLVVTRPVSSPEHSMLAGFRSRPVSTPAYSSRGGIRIPYQCSRIRDGSRQHSSPTPP